MVISLEVSSPLFQCLLNQVKLVMSINQELIIIPILSISQDDDQIFRL